MENALTQARQATGQLVGRAKSAISDFVSNPPQPQVNFSQPLTNAYTGFVQDASRILGKLGSAGAFGPGVQAGLDLPNAPQRIQNFYQNYVRSPEGQLFPKAISRQPQEQQQQQYADLFTNAIVGATSSPMNVAGSAVANSLLANKVKLNSSAIFDFQNQLKDFDSLRPAAQMDTFQKAQRLVNELVPDFAKSGAARQLATTNPREWLNQVDKLITDTTLRVKGPNYNFGFSTRPLQGETPSAPQAPPTQEIASNLGGDFLGTINSRIGESNQLANEIKGLIRNQQDGKALYIYQELKNDPTKALQVEQLLQSGNEKLAPYKDLIAKALNPTPEFQQAGKLLDQYFKGRFQEGSQLGYIKGNIENYITHIIQKGEEAQPFEATVSRTPISRGTPFGQGRVFPTIIDAILAGKEPATLDVPNILRIYGDRDAVANATTKFINSAKESGAGGWFHPDEIPTNWSRLDPYGRRFENVIPAQGEKGPIKVTQVFAVPNQLAKAMKPVIDPDWLKNVGGIANWRFAQSYVKYINLSLSLFHAKALTLTALASDPTLLMKVIRADINSPFFKEGELDLLKHTGTSPILGQEYNAYREVNRTGGSILTKNPISALFDRLASFTSGITFDQIQRRTKVLDYSTKVANWMAGHADATEAALNNYKNQVGRYVNSAYGGLNWADMGLTKSHLTLLRSLLLAPDWTVSNLIMPLQAARGQIPAGMTAKFMATGFATGILLTQMMNKFLNGKFSSDPFNVTLGYRKDGTEAKANMFFAGAQKDMITAFNNIKDLGPGGLVKFFAGKAAPFTRNIAELIQNQDYYGNPIFNPGRGFLGNTLEAAKYLGTNVFPLPFSVSGPLRLAMGTQGKALPAELLLAATGLGQVKTSSPTKEAYKQAYNESIGAGENDLEAKLRGINAQKNIKNFQEGLMEQGTPGNVINQQATDLMNQMQPLNQLRVNMNRIKSAILRGDMSVSEGTQQLENLSNQATPQQIPSVKKTSQGIATNVAAAEDTTPQARILTKTQADIGRMRVQMTGQPQEVNGMYMYQTPTGGIKSIPIQRDIQQPTLTGDSTIDKQLLKNYKNDINKRIGEVAQLVSLGRLNVEEGKQEIAGLGGQTSSGGGGGLSLRSYAARALRTQAFRTTRARTARLSKFRPMRRIKVPKLNLRSASFTGIRVPKTAKINLTRTRQLGI